MGPGEWVRRAARAAGIAAGGAPVDLDAIAARLGPAGELTVVDVGAHRGGFLERLATRRAIGRGVLVEPVPEHAAALRDRFPEPRFSVFACAAGDEDGEADFEVNEFSPTSSLLPALRDAPELAGVDVRCRERLRVPVRRLDGILAESGVGRVDLLKVDVQGAEHLVLRGAAGCLPAVRVVWIEVSFRPLYEGSATFAQVHEALHAAGFRLVELLPEYRGPDGELLQANALLERRS